MSNLQAVNAYNQSLELVERFAQCLLKDSKTENDLAAVKELASYITYFNNEIELNSRSDRIFENFVNLIDSATEKPDCDKILRDFHEEIEKVEKHMQSTKKNEKYINFMKMISDHTLEDTEIRTVSETVSTIDPISKLPIVDPVKNKICGHTYEKTSILQLIEQNPRTRCPIPGCNAADFVKKGDLIPNNSLKRILSSANSNMKKFKIQE